MNISLHLGSKRDLYEKVKYHSYPCKGENYLEDNFGVGWLWIRISQEKVI